jgi:hypothetical protein
VERLKNGQFKKGHKGYVFWLGKKRGRPSIITREKQSIAMLGRKKTKKHRNNIRLARIGTKNPSWKGGRYKTASGHILIYAPNHPARNVNNRIFEHRLIIENKIGRRLKKGEAVHHIDGCPNNNKLSNLFLTNTRGNSFAHNSLNKLIAGLIKDKIIYFNKKQGKYERRNFTF